METDSALVAAVVLDFRPSVLHMDGVHHAAFHAGAAAGAGLSDLIGPGPGGGSAKGEAHPGDGVVLIDVEHLAVASGEAVELEVAQVLVVHLFGALIQLPIAFIQELVRDLFQPGGHPYRHDIDSHSRDDRVEFHLIVEMFASGCAHVETAAVVQVVYLQGADCGGLAVHRRGGEGHIADAVGEVEGGAEDVLVGAVRRQALGGGRD